MFLYSCVVFGFFGSFVYIVYTFFYSNTFTLIKKHVGVPSIKRCLVNAQNNLMLKAKTFLWEPPKLFP